MRGRSRRRRRRGLLIGVVLTIGATLTACDINDVAVYPVANVTATTAVLNAYVDVDAQVRYYFQYGTTTKYGRTTPTATLPAGFKNQVRAVVTGLSARTTYHNRLCLVPPKAPVSCWPDQTFTTSTPNNRPIVLLIHGGAFVSGTPSDSYVCSAQKFFEQRGIAWLSLDYPIANGNPVEAETEAERVVAALKSDGHAVYAFGWSTGATIALWLAIHDGVVAAAAMAGPTDLWVWNPRLKASGWTKANADAASPLLHLPESEAIAPILLLHALDDSIVPYSHATNLVATASTKGIAPQPQVITYDAGNHAIINLSAPNADARGWLVSLISGSGTSTTTTTTTTSTSTATSSTSTSTVPELGDSTTGLGRA